MTNKDWPVHWSEGLALTPQHFQAADRHTLHRLVQSEDGLNPYAYGIRSLSIQVTHDEVVVSECVARFRDGTWIVLPDALAGKMADLRVSLSAGARTTGGSASVVLAIRPGDRSFDLETVRCRDENGIAEPVEIDLRRPKVDLLIGDDWEHPGFMTLPIARVNRDGVSARYIPPMLAIDKASPLHKMIEDVSDLIYREVEPLAEPLRGRPLEFSEKTRDEFPRVIKLLMLNGAGAHLRSLLAMAGLPPWVAYLELCRIAGQLALFLKSRRLNPLPEYDHDNLHDCFEKVIDQIKAALADRVQAPFEVLPFVRGEGVRLEVAMSPAQLDDRRQRFLGVATDLKPVDCAARLKAVDLSIASPQKVANLLLTKNRGIGIKLVKTPPGFPDDRVVYFEFVLNLGDPSSTDSTRWNNVKSEGKLAIDFNKDKVKLDQSTLRVPVDQQFDSFEFSLYFPT